jgi:hypothetical protein
LGLLTNSFGTLPEDSLEKNLLVGNFLRYYRNRIAYQLKDTVFSQDVLGTNIFSKCSISKSMCRVVCLVAYGQKANLRSIVASERESNDLLNICESAYYQMILLRIANLLSLKESSNADIQESSFKYPHFQKVSARNKAIEFVRITDKKECFIQVDSDSLSNSTYFDIMTYVGKIQNDLDFYWAF